MIDITAFVRSNVKKNETVLDIGCGNGKGTVNLKCERIITLDAWDKTKPDILLDLSTNSIPFAPDSMDVVIMIDFIEHLEKEQGIRILREAKDIARRLVIIYTPLWWSDNSQNVENPDLWCYGNPYDYHKCVWTEVELSELGFVDHKTKPKYFTGVYEV